MHGGDTKSSGTRAFPHFHVQLLLNRLRNVWGTRTPDTNLGDICFMQRLAFTTELIMLPPDTWMLYTKSNHCSMTGQQLSRACTRSSQLEMPRSETLTSSTHKACCLPLWADCPMDPWGRKLELDSAYMFCQQQGCYHDLKPPVWWYQFSLETLWNRSFPLRAAKEGCMTMLMGQRVNNNHVAWPLTKEKCLDRNSPIDKTWKCDMNVCLRYSCSMNAAIIILNSVQAAQH